LIQLTKLEGDQDRALIDTLYATGGLMRSMAFAHFVVVTKNKLLNENNRRSLFKTPAKRTIDTSTSSCPGRRAVLEV
jgi:hypothetical protein